MAIYVIIKLKNLEKGFSRLGDLEIYYSFVVENIEMWHVKQLFNGNMLQKGN